MDLSKRNTKADHYHYVNYCVIMAHILGIHNFAYHLFDATSKGINYMFEFFIIIVMAVLSMASGGSLPGSHLLGKKGDSKAGIMPINLTWLPEMLFALVIGFCGMQCLENLGFEFSFIIGFFVWAALTGWAYIWMQTGHAAILPWDKADKRETKSRDNTLSPFVRGFCNLITIIGSNQFWHIYDYSHTRYDGDRAYYTESYVWIFAGIKGFLIGLPVGGFANAIFWPLGYEIGSHAKNHLRGKVSFDLHMVSEGSSGAGAGASCVIGMAVSAFIGGIIGVS